MKKIFKTDSETIEVKELLKEIDQAEEILDNLRLKDPIYKKRQRREKFFIIMIASVSLIFIFVLYMPALELVLIQHLTMQNVYITTA